MVLTATEKVWSNNINKSHVWSLFCPLNNIITIEQKVSNVSKSSFCPYHDYVCTVLMCSEIRYTNNLLVNIHSLYVSNPSIGTHQYASTLMIKW